MYTSFYALSAKPFNLTPDPDFLYLSRNHKEALAHLTYGVESKTGFVMVTGEVGAGKTTLLRTLIANLGDQIVLSQVTNTRVSYKELLELVLEDFGLNPRGLNKTALLSTLNDFLVEKYREGKNCVLIIDEAQNLGAATLEGVRMLSNLETDKAKLLHTILSGQPNLRDLIDSPELEQLRQRITVRYHLGPLSVGEVGEYIRHRIGKVVTDPDMAPVFPEDAVPTIHGVTGGIPRLINVLCDATLLHGYVEEKRVIDERIIDEVAEQVRRDQKGSEPPPPSEENDPQPDPAVDQRIAQIEARLEAVLAGVTRGPPLLASSQDVAERAQIVTGKEQELEERRKEIEQRASEVEKRETEFNRRLSRVKAEWKKRMQQLESSRKTILKGAVRFPPLKVYVCDPDPRLQNSVADLLDEAGIVTEMHGNYQELTEALRESGAGGWFAVAVLGSGADDAENLTRVSSLSSELAHVPTVFLSDMDLSTVRRKIFSAGANQFLEKPNGRASSFATHREAMANFNSDLLRTVQGLHRQYHAFFNTFVVEDGEASELDS